MGPSEINCRYCGSIEHASDDCPHERGILYSETECKYCGSKNHSSSNCPHERGLLHSETKCKYCGSLDHASEDCPHERGILYRETECKYCGSKNHSGEDCPHERGFLYSETKCKYCGSNNHSSINCPHRKDDDNGTGIIGRLIGVIVVVAGIIWLAVNIVLPIVVLNSALAFTILAVVKKSSRTVFVVIALIGGCYLIVDILNGWLSLKLVNNIVKDKSWITAFVFINSAAIGLCTWFLVYPLWKKARLYEATENQKRIILMSSSVIIEIIAVASLPVLYKTIQNPFSDRVILSGNTGPDHAPRYQEPTPPNISAAGNTASPAITQTKTLKGSVGNLSAIYSLTWHSDGTINGTYNYPGRPGNVYTLTGRDFKNGNIELTEYTDSKPTANCNLTLQQNCYVGQMNNTDGRQLAMTMCEQEPSPVLTEDAFYILNVAAVKTGSEAIAKSAELKAMGYSSGYLWIPDYASLSGAQFYSVYIGPYANQYDCEVATEEYRKTNPGAYGLLVSQEPARVQINGIGKVIKTSNLRPGNYTVMASPSAKVYFYNAPDYSTKRKAYFSTEESVYVKEFQNNFGYVEFTNELGRSIGWIESKYLIINPD